MNYLVLLIGAENENEVPGTPEFEAGVAEYDEFEKFAGEAVVWGAALHPPKQGLKSRGGVVTDGPYTETAEVVGGLYVLAAANLDDAIEMARRIPAARDGAVEMWPIVEWTLADNSYSENWAALIREPATETLEPGTPEWEKGVAEHDAFCRQFSELIRGGAALQPAEAATTVRIRNGELMLTDGPYAESAEVVNGLYLFCCSDEQARSVVAQVPVGPHGGIELRQIVSM